MSPTGSYVQTVVIQVVVLFFKGFYSRMYMVIAGRHGSIEEVLGNYSPAWFLVSH